MNKKILIPIIVILIIAAGIATYFILKKPAPEPQTGKCGDGVCDEFEKSNLKLCPKDCEAVEEEILLITPQELGRGWYWGFKNQKKSGTPDDWIHSYEGTKSACWHRLGIKCGQE